MREVLAKGCLSSGRVRSNISDFGIDMIPEIPSIDPTSTCLHAENPQATAIVLKWRTFQKLILLPGPEKTCTRPRKNCDTPVGRIRYILCQACEVNKRRARSVRLRQVRLFPNHAM